MASGERNASGGEAITTRWSRSRAAARFPAVKRQVKHAQVHHGKKGDGIPILSSIRTGIVDHKETHECLYSISSDGYLIGE